MGRVRIREMLPDITKRCGPEKRIANGVDKYVCVTMAVQSTLKWNIHTTQPQLTPANQSVNIKSMANTDQLVFS
jgi:hypothetical protein